MDNTLMTANPAPADDDIVPLEQLTEWPEETKTKIKAEYGTNLNGKPSPKDILRFCQEYEACTDGMHRTAERIGLQCNWVVVWALLHCDTAAKTRWSVAQTRKSAQHVEAGREILENLPENGAFYQTDKVDGHRVLASSAASILNARAQYRLKLAQIAETGTTVPSSRSESTSRNLHVNLAVTPAATGAELAGQLTDLLGL